MKKFKVTITETLSKNVEIVASDYKEAIKQAKDKYYAEDNEYVLSDDDYSGANFDVFDTEGQEIN